MNRPQEMETRISVLDELRDDMVRNQRSGLPFIMASVVIWTMISVVTSLDYNITVINTLVFCCSCPLMPLACFFGKILGVDIFEKNNPLGKLGFLFTMNQMIYLLIVMWVFRASPESMVMVYAIVFGAHLLPYSWLYKTRTYLVASIIIPLIALFTGTNYGSHVVAICIAVCELVFTLALTYWGRS